MALKPDLTCGEGGSTGAAILDRINEHEAEIGDLALLTTTEKSNLTGAVNEVDAKAVANEGTITANTADIATNVAAIATNTADIATNAADIATLQTQVGLPTKGSMRLDTTLVQTIGNVYETMECFTAVSSERGDVDVTVGTVGSIEYTGTAPAEGEIHYGFNAEFASNEEIEVIPYVNGIAYSSNPMVLRGLGAGKPVSFFWISQVTIQPNDVITLMARSSITNDLDITFDRSVFALKIDG